MSTENVRREDWVVGGLALVLVFVLLELPWYTIGGGTVSGISLPSISNPATGSPAAFLGVLAVLGILAVLFDVVFEHLSPDTDLPAIDGNRSHTRFILASVAFGLLALKFLLHLTEFGHLGVGFWLGIVLSGVLVLVTLKARREEPKPQAADEDEDEDEPKWEDGPRTERDAAERSDRESAERSERESVARSERESPAGSAQTAAPGAGQDSGQRSEPSSEEPERSAQSGP